MIHRPTIIAGLLATFLSVPPVTSFAALILSPNLSELHGSSSPAQGKVDEGLKALHADDLRAAEAAFSQAIKTDPKLGSAFIGMAEIAGRKNKPTEVESWLLKALDAEPGRTYSHIIWGHFEFQRGQFKKAEAAYKRALTLDDKSVDALIYLAENYLRGLKKPKEAEEAYRAAMALDANSLPAHLGLAATLAAQGRIDEAASAYEQAAKLAPKDPKPTHSLARLWASQGKFDQALAALQRSLTIAPDFLPAHLDRGDLYLGKNELDKAADAYRAGAKATRKPAIAYFKLGTVLEGQQRWADAEQAYLAAVKDDPLMFAAYNNLAFMAAARKERLDDALVWAKKAVAIAPTVTTIQDTLGWVYFARGELDPAAKAIAKAVANNPKKASFAYHLGVVYAQQGKKTEAVAMLKKSLDLDKNFYQADDARKRLQQLSAQ